MDNELVTLPNEIGALTVLRSFDVSVNKLRLLPPDLGALESIEEFSLSRNPVIDELDREAKKGRAALWEYLKSDEYFKIYYASIEQTVEEEDKKLSGKDKQY